MKIFFILVLIYCAFCYWVFIKAIFSDFNDRKKNGSKWHFGLRDFVRLISAPCLVFYLFFGLFLFHELFGDYIDKIKEVYKHGGIRNYKEWKKRQEKEKQEERERRKAEEERHAKMKADYLSGKIQREDLPRLDGVREFEFEEEMNLSVNYDAKVREIVYVENEYCELLNDFFIRHKGLRLYHMYKFIYLPHFSKELNDGGLIRYMFPDADTSMKMDLEMDSTYPLKYLWYPEESKNIKHGMMFFVGNCDNHGAKYTKGRYYHLNEGSDEDIIAQLHAIVKEVHSDYCRASLYSTVSRPTIEEGSSDEYADELFLWVLNDPEVAIIVDEVRERVKALKERGMAEKILLKLFLEKPKLSKLVITKDIRIVLPNYQNMEIKMEPIVKAVYLLFLRHPEGIVFKYLPDFRRELADIYQKIKPLGLNERAIKSIEDVTNPCLNSINEKCARIRGAFISQFDESLAKHYYIDGRRGEAKKIALPRDLVVWE